MKIELGDQEIFLVSGKPLRLPGRKGQSITCTSGVLWLTVSGDKRDILLGSGESLTVASKGRVVIEAVDSARLKLESPLATSLG